MAELYRKAIRAYVYERANGCCEYCQTCEANIGQPMHVEYILPNEGDELDNLCLSCANCSFRKAKVTMWIDPEQSELIPLFDPRKQYWSKHFQWTQNGIILRGLTPEGRATIVRLKINHERVLIARRRWVMGGFHPPDFNG
jgi:hypothetical protein